MFNSVIDWQEIILLVYMIIRNLSYTFIFVLFLFRGDGLIFTLGLLGARCIYISILMMKRLIASVMVMVEVMMIIMRDLVPCLLKFSLSLGYSDSESQFNEPVHRYNLRMGR